MNVGCEISQVSSRNTGSLAASVETITVVDNLDSHDLA